MFVGLKFNEEALEQATATFARGSGKRWITFAIEGETAIVVDAVDAKGASDDLEADWEAFAEQLPEDEVRFAAYHFEFDSAVGSRRGKMLFVLYTPGSAGVKAKMMAASFSATAKKQLAAVTGSFQATLQGGKHTTFEEAREKVLQHLTVK